MGPVQLATPSGRIQGYHSKLPPPLLLVVAVPGYRYRKMLVYAPQHLVLARTFGPPCLVLCCRSRQRRHGNQSGKHCRRH